MIAEPATIAALAPVCVVVAGISAYLTLTAIIKGEDTFIVPDYVGRDELV